MNKFYIKIFFFLLSISLYLNNKTIATELPKKNTKPKSRKFTIFKSKKCYHANDNTEEIYEKNKHLLYTDTKETISACKFMKTALKQLEYHATNKDGYRLIGTNSAYHILSYKKKQQGDTKIVKAEYVVFDLNKYNKIINKLWDPDSSNFFYAGSVKRKIARVYTPNLVIIQQRSRRWLWSRQKYFYAIAAKFKISENKTIFVMASPNINDHNSKNTKFFQNTIIKNANLFKVNIDSENDIRNGKLKKMFVNLSGYIVEKKKDHIYVTYFESISE
ncbi:fam-a protein [Plasmodium yoelii yoelii]|uniref:Fam-a protein n=1 Tax=Plasmodium yoelii yoelii TaxID=73239 RepID=A0AAE9X013_PLAYO|nr:fam-a protein [Plasmodium yoelii yoelii]